MRAAFAKTLKKQFGESCNCTEVQWIAKGRDTKWSDLADLLVWSTKGQKLRNELERKFDIIIFVCSSNALSGKHRTTAF